MATLTYHGHSCWEVTGAGHRVLFDPFLADNPLADVGPDHFDTLDAILLTHGHGDHIADVEDIAKRTGALVVANKEVCDYFAKKGCTVHEMHIGGQREFAFGRIKITIAHHGSSTPDGAALGVATGIVLTIDGKKIYNAGDTGVFLDMQLIAEINGPLDVAVLPIGDNYTMGIDEAVKAAELIRARVHIPQHYNTFPVIEVDPAAWAERVEALGFSTKIIAPGEAFDIP